MHIYPWQLDPQSPPPKLTIDLCYTIAPMKFHILKNAHMPMVDGSPPIEHRSRQHHYTQ